MGVAMGARNGSGLVGKVLLGKRGGKALWLEQEETCGLLEVL